MQDVVRLGLLKNSRRSLGPRRDKKNIIHKTVLRACSAPPSGSMSDADSHCYLVFTRCLSRWRSVSVSLYPWRCLCLESTIMALFRHNIPQPTQAQLMKDEFPETLCIEQGVVISCRFAEWTVRWTSRVLWMAVVSQSSENSSRQENRELS